MSDIHGNLEYLKAVLKDIEDQKADKIFICGDLALMGRKPQETLDIIIEFSKQKNVSIVRGNCDEMIITAAARGEKILRPDQVDFLVKLPQQRTEKIGKLKLLLVHGSPRQINEYIYPYLSEQTVKEIISGVVEDVIFCGHTHIPNVHKVGDKTIINAGSVGRPHDQNPYPCYAIMDYSDLSTKNFTITHRFIK